MWNDYRLPSEKVENCRAESTTLPNSQCVCWGGKTKKMREERLLRIAVLEEVLRFHPLLGHLEIMSKPRKD